MNAVELQQHIDFFTKVHDGTGNAYRVSVCGITEDIRAKAEGILNERIKKTKDYVRKHKLYRVIANDLYGADRPFDLYKTYYFHRDLPKLIKRFNELLKDQNV